MPPKQIKESRTKSKSNPETSKEPPSSSAPTTENPPEKSSRQRLEESGGKLVQGRGAVILPLRPTSQKHVPDEWIKEAVDTAHRYMLGTSDLPTTPAPKDSKG